MTRVLRCGRRTAVHRMCPLAERHLIRLAGHDAYRPGGTIPLLPDQEGRVVSKLKFIGSIRLVLECAGIPVVYHGQEFHRFGGHCLRVSGAMMLAASGTPTSLGQSHRFLPTS